MAIRKRCQQFSRLPRYFAGIADIVLYYTRGPLSAAGPRRAGTPCFPPVFRPKVLLRETAPNLHESSIALTNACLRCATENPPDHSHCHQCGSRLGSGVEAAAPGPSPALVRRPPDESKLPPPGSFRSGLYRLIRALFVNQKPASSRPLRIARGAGKGGAHGTGSGRVRQ